MSAPVCDVCVVGGGIIGLAVAFELTARGDRVVLLEADAVGRQAAAGVAAGMIAPVSEAASADPALTELGLASHALYPDWIARVEHASGQTTGLDQSGTLWVALHRDHQAALEHLRGFQADRGLSARPLSAAELREREPLLSPRTVGGLLAADDWQVDPRRLLQALSGAIVKAGGAIREHSPAQDLEPHPEGWQVAGPVDRVVARQIVLAPGARGALLTPWLADAGLRPVKGQILRLRGERQLGHVVRTPDIYAVPRADGELVVGATMEEMGFDARVTAGAVYELLREAGRVLPGISEMELAEARAGWRPAFRDHRPVIGRLEEGVLVAAGHYRTGVEMAPITARLIAELAHDAPPDPLLTAFDPCRFREAVAPP